MIAFKGTPGPWEWDSEDGILARHEDIGIGAVFPCDPCRYRKGEFEYGAVTESNARLIAAAPDLLVALSDLLNHYVKLVESGDAGFWDAEQEPEVITARAAIAKATGDQP